MKLYGSLTSPYVRKARVLIREKNLPCEFVVADAWAADSPIPPLNPLGKVPVLVLDNGEVLFDSPVIVEYLDALIPPALLAAAGEARWQMLRWEALADGILDAVVARLLESRRPAAQQSAQNIQRQEEKIARARLYRAPSARWPLAHGGPFHAGGPRRGRGARIHRLPLPARLARPACAARSVAHRHRDPSVVRRDPAAGGIVSGYAFRI